MINFVMQQNSLDSGILLTMNVMLGLALGAAHHPTPLSEKARVYLCATYTNSSVKGSEERQLWRSKAGTGL